MAAKTPPETKEAKPSASAMFKKLIMAGKLTDDQIFEEVKEAFGLDDGKRKYVAWYRNALKKEGQDPPGLKGAAASKAVSAAKPPKAEGKAPAKAAKGKAPAKAKGKAPAKKVRTPRPPAEAEA